MGNRHYTGAAALLPLALAAALAAGQAHALGLGPLEVKSQLNQPLVAEIPLLGVESGELDALSVRLASPEAFERVGLPRPAGVTANLQFSVGRNARGEPVVRVTTSNRVDDPFVAFLLEADWGKGSVVREFTALIDPPHIAAATVTPMAAPTVAAAPTNAPTAAPVAATAPTADPDAGRAEPLDAAPVAPAPPPPREASAVPAPPTPAAPMAPAPAPAAPAQASAPVRPAVPAAPPPAPALPGERAVQEGETLWRIASENRQGATVAQMMLAIQRANPDAFLRDNINLLRKGAVLRIPTAAEAGSVERVEAESRVREQMAAWRGSQPAPAPTPSPGVVSAPPAAPPVRAASTAPTSPPAGRLEIAPPSGSGAAGAQSGAATGGAGSELRAELEQAREDLSARDAELRELRSRLTEQEALANEQRRLIELKDSQLSAMEEALRQQRTGAEEEETVADAAPVAAAPVSAAAPAAMSVAPAAASDATPNAEPAAASDAAPAAATRSILENPLVLGGGALLLVGGLVALLLRRRDASRKAPLPTPAGAASRSRLSDDSEFLAQLPAAAAGASAASAGEDDAPLLAREDDAARDGSVSADPAPSNDPREAAVLARPGDLDAHVALLRERYNAGDSPGFLAAAERMRPNVTEPGDPRWREVVVMGMGLVPGHPLFREVRWNAINSADVHTRATGPAPVDAGALKASAPAPEPDFFERETAERPAVEVPDDDGAGMDDTRLELAKAYIEIGDADGARGMLEEVLAEGSPAARSEAERLLKQIG